MGVSDQWQHFHLGGVCVCVGGGGGNPLMHFI